MPFPSQIRIKDRYLELWETEGFFRSQPPKKYYFEDHKNERSSIYYKSRLEAVRAYYNQTIEWLT